MKLDIDSLAPNERNVLLVASDAKYDELVTEIAWWRLWPTLLLPVAALSPVGVGLIAGVGARYAGDTFRRAASEWASTLTRRREILFPHLSLKEAASRFRFDVMHPQDGCFYARAPHDAGYYLPVGVAEMRLAQEKYSAFRQLMGRLGAKSVRWVRTQKEASDKALQASLGKIGVSATAGFTHGSASGEQEVALLEFDPPELPFEVPETVRPWLDQESSWRQIIDGRLRGTLRHQTYLLSLDSETGMTGEVAADLKKRWKASVGGTISNWKAASMALSIDFYPKVLG